MFHKHTRWIEHPCYYVIAVQGFQRAWLAGPYRTRIEADTVLPRVISWATSESGDIAAANYRYQVLEHHHGETRSIMGEQNATSFQAAQVMREALRHVAHELSAFKPDYLRNLGLGMALEQVTKALDFADGIRPAPADATAEDNRN